MRESHKLAVQHRRKQRERERERERERKRARDREREREEEEIEFDDLEDEDEEEDEDDDDDDDSIASIADICNELFDMVSGRDRPYRISLADLQRNLQVADTVITILIDCGGFIEYDNREGAMSQDGQDERQE